MDWDKIVLVITLLIVLGGKNKSFGWGKGVGGGGVSLINAIWQLWRSGQEVGEWVEGGEILEKWH